MAAVARFCGRCGAQVAPGAPFCGRCGAPVAAAQAVAAQPVYAYPVARPATYPTPRRQDLSRVMIAGGLLAALAMVTVVISAFAVSHLTGGSLSTCTANCAPKIVTPLPDAATYRSSAFNYRVSYNASWTVRAQDANGVTLGTRIGSVQVVGSKGGSAGQALQSTVAALPTGTWQNVVLVGSVKGTHIGDQDGVGSLYAANLIGAGGAAVKVRFAVIAATRAGTTVVILAVNPVDLKSSPSGMPEAPDFDYLCTEFVWG